MARLGPCSWPQKFPWKSLCGSLFGAVSQEGTHMSFFLRPQNGGFGWGKKVYVGKVYVLCLFRYFCAREVDPVHSALDAEWHVPVMHEILPLTAILRCPWGLWKEVSSLKVLSLCRQYQSRSSLQAGSAIVTVHFDWISRSSKSQRRGWALGKGRPVLKGNNWDWDGRIEDTPV